MTIFLSAVDTANCLLKISESIKMKDDNSLSST